MSPERRFPYRRKTSPAVPVIAKLACEACDVSWRAVESENCWVCEQPGTQLSKTTIGKMLLSEMLFE